MILILSKEYEESTNNVIDWLEYYNASYFRCNGDNFDLSDFFIEISNTHEDKISNIPVPSKDVKIVWYRRWGNIGRQFKMNDAKSNLEFYNSINKYITQEKSKISHAFFSLFEHSYWLSKPAIYTIDDKFLYLKVAKSTGINIPDTYILNNKSRLLHILQSGIKLISKSMSNAHRIRFDGETYIPYTEEITLEDLDKLEETFFVSLFQEKIEKEYEIRTFFLEGDFYSMAIFSQFDDKTKIDFRKYNLSKPNRTVPYRLPRELRNKLELLMQKLNLNTGSIDIIKSKTGKYYFLEVNPVGQFGMTSLPCNYYLEKKIAEFLISKNN